VSEAGRAESAVAAPGRHYAWVVVGVTFCTLLVASGIRAAPGVLLLSLEREMGWSRAAIAFAVSIGLLLYGLVGPFAGRLMDRFGPRAVMLAGLLLMVGSQAAGATISTLWQLNLMWGVLGGIGTGMAAQVLGATVANRWFVARRGLVLGYFGAAGSAGQLLFVPLLMALVVAVGWRASHLVLAGAGALVLIPVFLLMRDDPADLGLRPYGAPPPPPGSVAPAPVAALTAGAGIMARAVRVPEFWLLSGSFFVCGATSNGLIGTHLIPHSADHGISEVTAAGALALMGSMNFVGTVASGWLTDRYDPRRLLACYYFFRGLSLFLLPFVADFSGLAIFAVVFGLDYIATVPPTSALTADIFGRRNVGTVFGWVFFSHQVGAALAAYLGGVARVALGDYQLAFLVAGTLAVLAAVMALRVDRGARPALQPASVPA
jgi:sugar phosphate permease